MSALVECFCLFGEVKVEGGVGKEGGREAERKEVAAICQGSGFVLLNLVRRRRKSRVPEEARASTSSPPPTYCPPINTTGTVLRPEIATSRSKQVLSNSPRSPLAPIDSSMHFTSEASTMEDKRASSETGSE